MRRLRGAGPQPTDVHGARRMTHSQVEWAAMVLLAAAVSLLLSHRSLRVPSLLPAARACLAFVALDAVRLAIDVGGRGGWRGWAWVDVGVFVMMSGPWAWLLMRRK